MRIISVGQYIDDKNVVNESFRSAVSFLDFDMLIWNPRHLFDEYKTQFFSPKHQGFRNIDDDDSPKLLDDINRRKNEVLELVKLGRTVIITLPAPDKCDYGTGEQHFKAGPPQGIVGSTSIVIVHQEKEFGL